MFLRKRKNKIIVNGVMDNIKNKLIRDLISFADRHGLTESRVGRMIYNNPAFIERLRAPDYSPTTRTVRKAEKFIKSYDKKVKKEPAL